MMVSWEAEFHNFEIFAINFLCGCFPPVWK